MTITQRLAVGVLLVMSGCVVDELGTSEQAVDSYTDGAFGLELPDGGREELRESARSPTACCLARSCRRGRHS